MPHLPKVYCTKCRRFVRPLRGLATYRCRECGNTFLPSEVADALDAEDRRAHEDARQRQTMAEIQTHSSA
jgi:hypothetical protein